MAISTLQQFQETLLENGDRGTAENLNAAPIQLRSDIEALDVHVTQVESDLDSALTEWTARIIFNEGEVDDHHILLEILKGNDPGSWVSTTTYAAGDYVNHNGSNWKSTTNNNVDNLPQTGSQSWELIELYASGTTGVGDGSTAAILDIFRKDFFATDGQTEFVFDDASKITTVSVFVDGMLYDINNYVIHASGITMNEPLKASQHVVILYNNALPVNSNILTTSIDVVATEGQETFEIKHSPGFESVWLDGLKLVRDVDYTNDINGYIITLLTPATAGQVISVMSFNTIVEDKALYSNIYMESASGALDLSQADVFHIEPTSDLTITFENVPAGQEIVSMTLEIVGGADYLITFDESIIWDNGIAPELSTGLDILGFYTSNNGVTWKGMVIGKDFR